MDNLLPRALHPNCGTVSARVCIHTAYNLTNIQLRDKVLQLKKTKVHAMDSITYLSFNKAYFSCTSQINGKNLCTIVDNRAIHLVL